MKTTELSSVPNRLLLGVSEIDEKLVNEVDDSTRRKGSFCEVPESSSLKITFEIHLGW